MACQWESLLGPTIGAVTAGWSRSQASARPAGLTFREAAIRSNRRTLSITVSSASRPPARGPRPDRLPGASCSPLLYWPTRTPLASGENGGGVERPHRDEYYFTTAGEGILPVLRALRAWGEQFSKL